jgi:hypothetical protein
VLAVATEAELGRDWGAARVAPRSVGLTALLAVTAPWASALYAQRGNPYGDTAWAAFGVRAVFDVIGAATTALGLVWLTHRTLPDTSGWNAQLVTGGLAVLVINRIAAAIADLVLVSFRNRLADSGYAVPDDLSSQLPETSP